MPSAAETADTYFGAVGRQDLAAMAASWKPGATSDIIGLANLTAPDGVIAWFTELFEAFPDFALVVKKVIADEGSAAVHWSATATFNGTGTFEGFKPNGATIDIEGIEKGYDLPEPMEENLYHLGPDELARRGIEHLPATLGDAIEEAADSELVLRTLGEHAFRRFIELKRQEWEAYRVQVTPFEIENFLPLL